jgi:hypothetical protein
VHSRPGSTRPTRAIALAILAATVLTLGTAACGGDDKADEPDTTTTEKAGTTTTAAPDDGDGGGSGTSSVWTQDAAEFRGQDGSTHDLTCTPDGEADSVWGAGTYTDDSSVCTAAVQSGLITFDEGGAVTYEIAPGLQEYEAGTANGVTSTRFGPFAGSFTFPDAPPGSVDFALGPESWARNATEYRGQDGTTFTIGCSADGPLGSAWGTDTYTDDSSICTAAVHSGVITVEDGGSVVIEIAPGQASYQGSSANGVTTSDYGAFDGSFTFPPT